MTREEELTILVMALADRLAACSEILGRLAERKPMKGKLMNNNELIECVFFYESDENYLAGASNDPEELKSQVNSVVSSLISNYIDGDPSEKLSIDFSRKQMTQKQIDDLREW